jgi:hypothetical protein
LLAEAAFDIELSTYRKHLVDYQDAAHVFVSGLARAGTTLLMRVLFDSSEFSSLTYRDMPFVLAPNMWSKLSGGSRKHMQAKERAHGDGMMVDFDSPEALEEVFWRVNCGKQYIRKNCLLPMDADSDVITHFRQYVNLVLHRYQGTRYLSKNNNNILRMPAIRKAFPNSLILVPFRNPRQHARSLMRQHSRFCQLQSEDGFVRKYMTWLGHHEFGLDHRPFRFAESDPGKHSDPGKIEYWMQRWIEAYSFVLEQVSSDEVDCLFVSYESLCSHPAQVLEHLSRVTGVEELKGSRISLKKPVEENIPVDDSEQLRLAGDIYRELSALSESKFYLA